MTCSCLRRVLILGLSLGCSGSKDVAPPDTGALVGACLDPDAWFRDGDGDGWGDADSQKIACGQPEGYVSDQLDCDDGDASIYPGAPETWYDGIDSDCAGGEDDDHDLDGYDGPSSTGEDCDDEDPEIHPGVTEVCDGLNIDEDCDGVADDLDDDVSPDTLTTFFPDGDGDGVGVTEGAVQRCDGPEGYVEADGDCDDTNPALTPDASETCGDGLVNACEGTVSEATLDCLYGLGRTLSADGVLTGAEYLDLAGSAVAGVGDVQGDGTLEVLVGAPGTAATAGWAGAAWLISLPVTGEVSLADGQEFATGFSGDEAATPSQEPATWTGTACETFCLACLATPCWGPPPGWRMWCTGPPRMGRTCTQREERWRARPRATRSAPAWTAWETRTVTASLTSS